MSNYRCRHCNVELSTEGVPSGRAYRCAACSELNFFIDQNLQYPSQKIAWTSFWMGAGTFLAMLLAVYFAFFASAPWSAGMLGPVAFILGGLAVYFGVTALLRNRYQRSPPSAKVAATGASLVGGCVGLFFGGMFSCVFIVGLIVSYFTIETRDAEKVKQVCRQLFDVELADEIEWTPALAETNPFFSRIEFWDQELYKDTRTRFYVTWMGAMLVTGPGQNNRGNLRTGSMRRITGGQIDRLKSKSSRTLDWEIWGEPVEVKRESWLPKNPDADDESEIPDPCVTYQTLVETESKTYCLTVLCKSPNEGLSEAQIKSMFESFAPLE